MINRLKANTKRNNLKDLNINREDLELSEEKDSQINPNIDKGQ